MGTVVRLSTLILISLITVSLVAALQNVTAVNPNSKTIVVPDDYSSIQSAINNAVEGDTIYIKKGVYVENPVVNKTVSVIGEDRDSTIIDVTSGLKVEKDNVTITGLTIYDGWQGITVSANNSKILGTKVTDSQYGIVLLSSQNSTISENLLQSIGLSAAIQLSYSNNNLIKNNNIESCTEGIQLREGSSYNTVTENTITNCQDVALRLLGSSIGTKWYGANNNTIAGNNISTSAYGTTVYGSSYNFISNNNYVNNSIQFSTNEDYYLTFGGTPSINTINRNYWSDYNGTDLNKDGVGDTPYVLDANNKDNSPLMSPIDIPIELPTSSPTSAISPSPTIPEISWLAVLPFLAMMFIIVIKLKGKAASVTVKRIERA